MNACGMFGLSTDPGVGSKPAGHGVSVEDQFGIICC
jgi:hypothetical protein